MKALGARDPNTTNWRVPYKGWTSHDLIIANQLRERPLPVRDLCLFQHHTPKSLHNAYGVLRESGRLTPDNLVNLSHASNLALRGTPKALPLPDPGERPMTRSEASQRAKAADLAEAGSKAPTLTKGSAASILAEWITTGAAGKDTHKWIETWVGLVGSANESGPPVPELPSDQTARLVRLLSSVPTHIARASIRLWEASLADLQPNRTETLGHGPDGSSEAPDPLRAEGLC